MSGTTTLGFPYPELTDDPNGAAQIQALAEAVDTTITTNAAKIEVFTKSINPGSVNAQTGQDFDVLSIPSLLAGDYVFFVGGGIRSQILRTDAVCTTPGQITMHQFNTDDVAVNIGPVDIYLLIIHQS
jgi:hypothetical protein